MYNQLLDACIHGLTNPQILTDEEKYKVINCLFILHLFLLNGYRFSLHLFVKGKEIFWHEVLQVLLRYWCHIESCNTTQHKYKTTLFHDMKVYFNYLFHSSCKTREIETKTYFSLLDQQELYIVWNEMDNHRLKHFFFIDPINSLSPTSNSLYK